MMANATDETRAAGRTAEVTTSAATMAATFVPKSVRMVARPSSTMPMSFVKRFWIVPTGTRSNQRRGACTTRTSNW